MLRDQLGGNCIRYLSFNVNLKKKKKKQVPKNKNSLLFNIFSRQPYIF